MQSQLREGRSQGDFAVVSGWAYSEYQSSKLDFVDDAVLHEEV
jgi:hypothetical protein